MRVVERTEVRFEWKDLENLTFHPEPKHKRSSGVHVSQVIKHIAIKLGKLTEHDKDDEMPLIVLLGMAWECYCFRLYHDLTWQPGELKYQGVIMSPDAYPHDPKIDLDECKYTTKSSRHRHDALIEEWMWMSQGMSYVKGKQQRFKLKPRGGVVRYHICWGIGDYSRPIRPAYYRYVVQFSQPEIDQNWDLIQRYKDQVEPEHHEKVVGK